MKINDTPMDFWQIADRLKIKKACEQFHDKILPWINRNVERCVVDCYSDKKIRTASLLALHWHQLGVTNRAEKASSVSDFEDFLETGQVRCWRGGGGVYDPDHDANGRGWDSFTIDRNKVKTFSTYDGTRAVQGYHVLKKREQSWIVEVDADVSEILLYIYQGYDYEVILPKSVSATAVEIDSDIAERATPLSGLLDWQDLSESRSR